MLHKKHTHVSETYQIWHPPPADILNTTSTADVFNALALSEQQVFTLSALERYFRSNRLAFETVAVGMCEEVIATMLANKNKKISRAGEVLRINYEIEIKGQQTESLTLDEKLTKFNLKKTAYYDLVNDSIEYFTCAFFAAFALDNEKAFEEFSRFL